MNSTDFLSDILRYILPSLIVFVTSVLTLKQFMDSQNRMKALELKMNNQKDMTPIRLQAYERIVLFLERISPANILLRVSKPGMSARMLQAELTRTIRQEFEHNLSQQIYMGSNAWELTRNAKEEMVKLVNLSAGKLNDQASGTELGQLILEASSKIEKLPTQIAIDYIKEEIATYF
ncbi:MAG: hypothetical protein K1X82_03635 [Bacteroidia bacterium]|nr:hypothetical protein [Bacteroidia bacterium]